MDPQEKEKILKLLGERIKDLRKKKNQSLLEAEYGSNFDNSNLSKYELGKRDLQVSTLFKIAKLLETHPKNLLDLGIDYSSPEEK
ncbi:helix-turn-helix domain-containing protein [Litoribacter populi]|uniref:helix-turn-helix domain-containing protein n=1 Tax=Litoribacter populi TaxID=2598460 RepID=UPI00117CC4FF|nr:helix-turn-helix transcriptional regulator [Litoribacter populi]